MCEISLGYAGVPALARKGACAMGRLSRAASAAAAVVVLLGCVTADALATTARIKPGGELHLISLSGLRFTSGRTTISCDVTLRGSMTTGSFTLEPSGTIGTVTEVSIRRESCSGGEIVRVLGLPWSIRYQSALALARERTALPDNVQALRVSIGPVGLELRGFSTANCLVEATLTALWEVDRTEQLYVDAYEFESLTLTEQRLPTIRNVGCGNCPSEVTASGLLFPTNVQVLRLGDPASWVASLGDSYISGEAGRWAGNTATPERVDNDVEPDIYLDAGERESIPYCHRSASAEVHIIHGVGSANFACSGARTYTFVNEEGQFKPGIDLNTAERPGQVRMLKDFAREHWVRMIAISIGGNDFNFGPTVEVCVKDYVIFWSSRCSREASVLANYTTENVALKELDITAAIERVVTAMREDHYDEDDYTIVVQTYERVVPPSEQFRYPQEGWTRVSEGGCPFWNEDANWAVAVALPTINEAIVEAVAEVRSERVRVMHVDSAFDGHRLCDERAALLERRGYESWTQEGASDISEWVLQIEVVATEPKMSQEMLHPNYWGQLALRNCLRQAYNNGEPRGGTCVGAGVGLTADGEPRMRLE